MNLFFDTYALFEIIKKNKNYAPYIKSVGVVTTILNLMELHYALLRTAGKEEADKHFDRLLSFITDISHEVVKEANEFKLLHKKRKLSYVDCIGYVIARNMNVLFLTGDNQFKGLIGVEFVK